MGSKIQFDQTINLDDASDIQVLTDGQCFPSEHEGERFCLFGTQSHIEALEKKKSDLEALIGQTHQDLNNTMQQLEYLKGNEDSSPTSPEITSSGRQSKEDIEMSQLGKEDIAFGSVHATSEVFGHLKNYRIIDYHHDDRRLFQKPIIRQYFIDNVLYRTKHERKVSWDELFFDLIFVSVISLVGENLHHHVTWARIHEYMILFFPVWSCWSSATLFCNRFGAQDLNFKIFMLVNSVLTVGMGITAPHVFPHSHGQESTYNIYMGCYVLSRLFLILCTVFYAWKFPQFGTSILVAILGPMVATCPLVLSLFLHGNMRLVLFWIAFLEEMLLAYIIQIISRVFIRVKYKTALNIEHFTERVGLFTIIVLGEVVAALNNYNSGLASVTSVYFAGFMGLLIGLSFQWIYFDVDASRQYLHAIRRHSFTGLLWNWLHYPLHLFIVMGAAGLTILLEHIGTADEAEWHSHNHNRKMTHMERLLFMGSFGMALCLISVIGMLHKSLDEKHGYLPKLSKRFRMTSRLTVASTLIILACFVPVDSISPLNCVLITSSLLLYQALMEEYGRLRNKQM